MNGLVNLDLFSVGIAIAGIGTLGFTVFFNNRRSVTNRTFLFFSLAGILWSIFNYSYYQFSAPYLVLWLLRIHAFFAVWYVFFIFQTFYVFPKERVEFSRGYRLFLIPIVILVSLLTLTPFVFSEVTGFSSDGRISSVANGPGIFLFGALTIGLVFSGPFMLLRKRGQVSKLERKQFSFVLLGALITFSLHFIFNLILPAFLNNPRFVPLGAIFIFPFVVFTAYAIFRHHLLNVKVIATEILTFVLAVTALFEVVLASEPLILIFRAAAFVLILSFGILLIRSILKEVEQREELERLNKQIAEKNVQLEELSRVKTQLLSLASHQIKSPLAVIKGFTTLLIDGSYGAVSAKAKEKLQTIKKASDDLITLINDLLDMRRVEEGRMEYQFAKTDMRKLAGEAVDALRSLAEAKKLELKLTASEKEIWVNADAPKLKQVVQNVIDNAIKYTQKGFVKVELRADRGTATLSVSDSGMGIHPDLLPHLFEEFVREGKLKSKVLGTGLGLYIARKIIEAHSGKIWAESAGEGKGSAFYIQLRKI